MTTSRYHKLVVLCTSIFCVQTVALPTSVLFSTSVEAVDVQEVTTDSSMLANDYLDGLREVTEVPLRFSPSNLRVTGEVTEPVSVSFYANKPTQEAKIRLPKEAVVDKERLPAGLTITETVEENHWLLHSEAPRETFTLPLIFQEVGTYEASVEEAKTTISIDSPTTSLEQTEEEQKSFEQKVDNRTDDATEESQHELSEPENNDPFVAETDEHADDEAESSIEKKEATVNEFSGQIAEVSTMVEFREAIADPDVSTISVQANLTESTANIMTIDRPIKIQGNGHTLTFGNNGFYFQFAEVSEPTTFRIEDATVTKTGATPLVNATTEVSRNWTLEIEDVAEVNANTMRLASIPEGTVQFTGGTSNFTRTSSAQTFIEAKEVKAINQAQVTISRGNATIFLAAATVSEPKLTIENGATVTITTTSGVANAIDFRGENAEITLQSAGNLTINTVGTTATPTNTSNNTIAMTGSGPKVTVRDKSNLTTTSTAAKRGLHLSGNNPQVIVNDSKLSVTSATQSAVNLSGDEPSFSVTNSHTDIRSTTGATLALTGVSPKVNYVGSTGSLTSTTGQRLNLIGANPLVSLASTEIIMNTSTGRGVYLQGEQPQVLIDDSQLLMTDTGASQGMILQGTDALLSLSNQSEMAITGAGTGTLENIQIGSNNVRPELLVTDGSKLSVATTSGTGAATDTTNNAIHLRGADSKATVTGGSVLEVSIASGARRGVYLNGVNAELNIIDSELEITTLSGRAINLIGENSVFKTSSSKSNINTGAGTGISISGANSLVDLNSSHIEFNSISGYGIELTGNRLNLKSSKSEISIKSTGSANGITMNGQDSFLEVMDNSQISIEGGIGVHESILLGNGNSNPSLKVSDNSNISIIARSNSNTAADGNNNAIRIDGGSPILEVSKNSKISIDVLSGGRRSIFMNGESAVLTVDSNSEILSNNLYGTSIGISTANAEVTVDNFSKINIESSARRNNPLINFAGDSNNLSIKNNASVSTKHVEFDNPGNNTRAISLGGSNNNINITSGGKLDLDNTHYTNRPSSGSISGNFSTVYLGRGNNSFSIDNDGAEGTRSQLRLINDYAAALYSDGGYLTFNQNPDTVFYAEGSSNSTQEYGVFVAGDTMKFNVDSPYYFDFKNVRQGGGDIFGTKAGSQLNITNTFFSAWSTGSNFDSDPMIGFFKKIDVAYEGRDFASASPNNNPDLSTSLPGLSGRVSRISANNSKPIFEGFRQPTNADKSFIAEFSYKEGLDDIRKAGTDEITAEIKVTDPDNNSRNYTASTVGSESPIQTWEEKEANDPGKGGRILFEFEDLLKKGSTIEFVSISRGSNEGTISLSEEELELISPITVLNVTPPELVDFGHNINLTTNTTNIEAFPNSINIPGNNALLYINNQFMEKQQVKNDGSFSFELKSKLMEGDEVQVSMEDNEGVLIDNFSTIDSVFRRPETNSEYGNRNPIANDYTYHDAIFKKAKTYIVELSDNVLPVDPLEPEIEVSPENLPVLPEEQGPLSIDFASRFNFGEQNISVKDKTYYAQPQRLLNEDGTVNETQDRPNYVQISDRRQESERNGWELAVTQKEQFKGKENQVLNGASISLSNQQVITAQGGKAPGLQSVPCELIPGNRRTLLKAQGNEGIGTWIYRFGDAETAEKSVALNVPKGSNPEATTYSTTLIWELSAVPGN